LPEIGRLRVPYINVMYDPCMTTKPARLCCNLSQDTARIIRTGMSNGITATETVRRAIGLLALAEEIRSEGGQLLQRSSSGEISRLELMF
jgi:hypothetical protein